MRPRIALLLVVIVAANVAAVLPRLVPTAGAYQHIANGSFEQGLAGWVLAPNTITSSAPATEMTPAEGLASARVDVGQFDAVMIYPLSGALGAGAYTVSVDARSGASGVMVSVGLRPSGGMHPIDVVSASAGNSWSAISGSFSLEVGVYASMIVRVNAAPGAVVYLDDMRLEGGAPVTLTSTPTRSPTPAANTATPPGAGASPTSTVTPPITPTPTSEVAVDVIGPGLRNGGFEDVGEDGAPFAWEKFGGALSRDSHARTGASAARFDSATASTKWVYQAVSVEGGAWYAFDAWVLHDDAAVESAFLRVSWYASSDGSGSQIDAVDSTSRLDTPAAAYRYLTTGSVRAPDEARSARLRIMLAPRSDARSAILIDDASFEPAEPLASTPAPAASPSAAGSASQSESGSASPANRSSRVAGARTTDRQAAFDPATTATSGTVINEIMYDPDSGDVPDADAEWVEIYNAGDAAIDLTGWSLRDGTGADVVPPQVVSAHGFVIVASSDAFKTTYPDVSAPVVVLGGRIGNGLGNDGDRLYLVDSQGAVADAVSWGSDITVFDPAVEDVPAGHSIERRVAGVDNDGADDFVDNEHPSPGGVYDGTSKPKQQSVSSNIPITGGSRAGTWKWVPWALAAASVAACAGTVGWRTLATVRERLRHP